MNDISPKLDTIIRLLDQIHLKLDMLGVDLAPSSHVPTIKSSAKGVTLAELARRNGLENGQQRVTAIVGYLEKMQGKEEILIPDIQQGWKDGKFSGSYAGVFLHRALKEGLVRQKSKGAYDLTQTGEDFFAKLFEPAK